MVIEQRRGLTGQTTHGGGTTGFGAGATTAQPTLGVILAGGHGHRMGGAGKPLLPLAGVPMLHWVATALQAMTGQVVVAAGVEAARYAGLGVECLPDPDLPLTAEDNGRAGPLAAILAGLEEAQRRGCQWVLTCPADVPLVPADLAARMADFLHRQGAESGVSAPGVTVEAATGAEGDIRWHPAIALLSVSLAPSLRQALIAGERRVGGWMRQAGTICMRWPESPGLAGLDPFSNMNTPDDLRRAEARLMAVAETSSDAGGSTESVSGRVP